MFVHLFRPLLPACALAMTAPPVVGSTVLFESDFSGSPTWNFDTETDPGGQLGGTDRLEYTAQATNGVSYVTSAITMSDFTAAETGTLTVSAVLDFENLTFGTSDFSKRNIISIGTDSGNKNPFDGTGALFNLGVGGFNNPGQFSLGQSLAVRFWSGGVTQIGNFQPAGLLSVEATITVSGNDLDGWVIDATTELSNTTGGTLSMTSTFTRTDAPFDGLQSIDRIQVGTGTGNQEIGAGNVLVIDDVSFALVPEPTAAALALIGLAGLLGRRRR